MWPEIACLLIRALIRQSFIRVAINGCPQPKCNTHSIRQKEYHWVHGYITHTRRCRTHAPPAFAMPGDRQTTKRAARIFFTHRYWALLLLILSVAGIMGNLMVILAVAKVTRLKSNTNRQLSSLATADLLVCVLVMPQGLLQLVTGTHPHLSLSTDVYIVRHTVVLSERNRVGPRTGPTNCSYLSWEMPVIRWHSNHQVGSRAL